MYNLQHGKLDGHRDNGAFGHASGQINRLFTGTVRDRQLFERVVKTLPERGIERDKKQVRSKLKVWYVTCGGA